MGVPNINIALKIAEQMLGRLNKGWTLKDGVYRPSFGREDNKGMALFTRFAEKLGAEAQTDLAGSAHFRFKGKNSLLPVFMTGSHIDAVPLGGRFDGTIGVAAGLAAMAMLRQAGMTPPQDVVVSILRGEESAWYSGGKACLGSNMIVGALKYEFLKTAKFKDSAQTLEARMQNCGIDTHLLKGYMDEGRPLFDLNQIGRYIEVHIEQGPALLEAGKSIGIVTDIRGNFRLSFYFTGQSAHTGTTPQKARRNAGRAAVRFVDRWYDQMDVIRKKKGVDLVNDMVDIKVIDSAPTSVPHKAFVQLEARSNQSDTLSKVGAMTALLAREVADDMNAGLIYPPHPSISSPSFMSPEIYAELQAEAYRLGISHLVMPSGAGHDAGIFASAGVPSGMLFVRHGPEGDGDMSMNFSHCRGERLGLDENDSGFRPDGDYANAIRVLAEMMMKPASNDDRTLERPFSALPVPLAA